MKTNDHKLNNEKVISQVCDALDASVSRIDAETSQKIIAARKNALKAAPKGISFPKLFTAFATALSIFIVVIIVNTQLDQPLTIDAVEAIELVEAQDTFEIYEDLEFYTWLAEEDVTS